VANDFTPKLIRIRTDYGKLVYGRVYLYDEHLKVIDSEIYLEQPHTEVFTGMAVYNVGNVKFEGEETGARELTEEEIINDY
jgi:hypothetical protein